MINLVAMAVKKQNLGVMVDARPDDSQHARAGNPNCSLKITFLLSSHKKKEANDLMWSRGRGGA